MRSENLDNSVRELQLGLGERVSSAVFRFNAGYMLSLVFFRLALDLTYYSFVSPTYANHFFLRLGSDFGVFQYAISLLLYALVSLLVASIKRNIESLNALIFMVFVFAPLSTVYGFDMSRSIVPVLVSGVAILLVSVLSCLSWGKAIRVPSLVGGRRVVLFAATGFVSLFCVWTILTGAINLINFDLAKIYLYRREVSGIVDVGFLAYLNIWTQKVFNPLLICLAYRRKNYLLLLVLLLVQVYFFGITSNRSLLFIPILALLFMWVYERKKPLFYLVNLFSIAVLATLTIVFLLDATEFGAILLRRAFFVPASATFEWFNYFSVNSPILWQDKLFPGLVLNEYINSNIPYLIGGSLTLDPDVSANVGLVSVGYAQMGMLGVLAYALIMAAVLKMLKVLESMQVPLWLIAAVMVNPLRIAWADSDLPTALVTHGVFIGMIVLWAIGGHAGISSSREPAEKGLIDSGLQS